MSTSEKPARLQRKTAAARRGSSQRPFLEQRRSSSRHLSQPPTTFADEASAQPDAASIENSTQPSRGGRTHTRHGSATSASRPGHSSSGSPSAILQGRVCHLNLPSGYGFLRPIIPAEDQLPNMRSLHRVSSSPGVASCNSFNVDANEADSLCSGSSLAAPGIQEELSVYFKLPPTKLEVHSSCYSGLMSLQHGDILEYASDHGSQKPRAIYTRLITCSSRSEDDMTSYLKSLLFHCLEDSHTDIVIQEVLKAPRGLLLILEHPQVPSQALVLLVLKLAVAVSDHCKASSNKRRVNEFLHLLIHTPLFMSETGGLCKLLMGAKTSSVSVAPRGFSATLERDQRADLAHTLVNSTKVVILQALSHIPKELPFLAALIQILDQMHEVDLNAEINSKSTMAFECSFAMQVIRHVAQASGVLLGSGHVGYDKLSLLPSGLEIKSSLAQNKESFPVGLPVAKYKGGYDSAEDYIDTYFRLLRHDSFASLMKGISDFLNDKLDHRDMTVWFGVSVTGVRFQQYLPGLMLGLQLDHDQTNWPRRRQAKLPLTGSLLCLCDSGGSFKNPLWVIAGRSVETSKKKTVLFVEVLENVPTMAREQFGSTLPWGRLLHGSSMVLAESPAYYRAYEPVLKALQSLDPKTMPFYSELVSARSPSRPPSYLNETTILDWSCLKAQDSYGELKAGVDELMQPSLRGFQTCLDSSQVGAVNHVLQNQLAMIQGPPGTGKTFLSVRIVELLLSASTRSERPMLIVTYKNRALDQFLGSCLRFCELKDMVRVGGRSTEPKLDGCNLNNLLQTAERKLTSDWAANCKKLANLHARLSRALSDLYKCQAVDMETVIKITPLRFEKKPSAPAVSDSISVELSGDTVSKDTYISDNAETKQCKALREWMPRRGVFEAVKGRFTSTVPNQRAKQKESSKHNSTTHDDQEDLDDDLDEDIDERKEAESLWQNIKGTDQAKFKGKKEIDWLTNNYLNLTNLGLENQSFKCQFLGNLDVSQYTWLLEEDPFELAEELRCILILVVMKRNFDACMKELLELKHEYDAVCTDNSEINKSKRVSILKEAKIIGMTTTGAAINQDILAAVSPSIILVEESGEILEPHLMALLSKNVEHLILIGDHKQLRPSVDCYQLETRHNLGISMLERLAENNKLPYQTLGLQSRMREEFLQMIKPIYPNLRSNLNVVNGARNQPAKCMASTMYFWNHTVEETTGRSPSNIYEAHMVVALLKWLLAEGHKHEEITVICAYNGQVTQIRKMLNVLKEEGNKASTKATDVQTIGEAVDDVIDVQTIDRYQGSENRIVIVSLVRSNKEGRIGHLKAQNRLCVTVSRARAGLYMCGNAETLANGSPYWRVLIESFKQQNLIGDTISLVCPRHPKDPAVALHHSKSEEFTPHVCATICNARLECGHMCAKTCHYGSHAPCLQKVNHVFPSCQHTVEKLCSDSDRNLKCMEEVWTTLEKCSHTKKCICWEKTEKVMSAMMCEVNCGLTLPCLHPCLLFCGQDCGSKPCPICALIKKTKAEKEREMQRMQMKAKKSEIEEEIEKLKSNKDMGPIFKELQPVGETAPEYRSVQDRTEKFIQPTHKYLPVVTRIEKVTNAKLELNFLQAKRDLSDVLAPTQMLFHGTDDGGVAGITSTGFRLPAASKNNMFGVGCYFATDSSKSAQQIYTKGSNKLLLCEVLLGRSWSVDSAKPELTRELLRKRGFDSVFSMRNTRATGGTEFDEYIIYNPSQAIPRYVVHYENKVCCTPDLQTLFQSIMANKNSKFGRVALKADSSSSATGTTDDLHFRLAESQFLRMCNNNKLKVEKVEFTWNQELEERYRKKKQQFESEKKAVNELWVFHGTKEQTIGKIVKEGFKVGGQDGVPIRCGAAYGSGVYTAANPETSVPYSSGSKMMLLSTALCGKLNVDYNIGGSSDVFVVKQGDQLLPKYVVHYR